jgi:hypothetical protein
MQRHHCALAEADNGQMILGQPILRQLAIDQGVDGRGSAGGPAAMAEGFSSVSAHH